MPADAAIDSKALKARLSRFDAVTLVAGSMIGSGIFIVSADIARQVGTPFLLLLVWLVSGLMTIAGALAYGELAAMMPQAGGQYVYLREAYGGLCAFLFGWTLLLVIQTGTIAAVAVAFGRFLGVLWPALGPRIFAGVGNVGLSGERIAAIAVIVTLTLANLRGLDTGRLLQNGLTSAKVLSLLLIVVVALLMAPNAGAMRANFGAMNAFFGSRPMSLAVASAFGAAMVGALFSADAWASVTFTAAELRNPRRDLPASLAIGTGLVITLYLLTNLAYLAQLPVDGIAQAATVYGRGIAGARADRVAAAAMEMVCGNPGAALTAILVMISTFGCANGLILTGARVIYAMARDRVFFDFAGRLSETSVPGGALILQGLWACVLALSGSYGELLDYVIFAQLLFYVLTVAAVFVLRHRAPDAARPYRAWGYPYVPAAYIVGAVALMIDLLIVKPRYTTAGLLIVLSGAPVYAWRMRNRPGASAASS
jgi:APA family basic amino acid/polyamine antiporter